MRARQATAARRRGELQRPARAPRRQQHDLAVGQHRRQQRGVGGVLGRVHAEQDEVGAAHRARRGCGSIRGRPVPRDHAADELDAAALRVRRERCRCGPSVQATSKPSRARCPAVAAATPSWPITQTRVRPAPGATPPVAPPAPPRAGGRSRRRPEAQAEPRPAVGRGARAAAGGGAGRAAAPAPWAAASAAANASKSRPRSSRVSSVGGRGQADDGVAGGGRQDGLDVLVRTRDDVGGDAARRPWRRPRRRRRSRRGRRRRRRAR